MYQHFGKGLNLHSDVFLENIGAFSQKNVQYQTMQDSGAKVLFQNLPKLFQKFPN